MMYTILSIDELQELLQTEEYTFIDPEREHIKEFEKNNSWTNREVFSLFDTQLEENGGKPPTPNQYLDKAVEMTKDYWYRESPDGRLASYTKGQYGWQVTYLQWNETMEKAVRWRLGRMYQSLMVEYSALSIIRTLYPENLLVTGFELDLCAGIDLAVISKERNKMVYGHVTKNSSWAEINIVNKAKKKSYLKDKYGNKHWWQRRFTNSHVVFQYDKQDSNTTQYLNGHFLFRPEYIQTLLEGKFQEEIDVVKGQGSELVDFHNFLIDTKVNPNGISDMVIRFTLKK